MIGRLLSPLRRGLGGGGGGGGGGGDSGGGVPAAVRVRLLLCRGLKREGLDTLAGRLVLGAVQVILVVPGKVLLPAEALVAPGAEEVDVVVVLGDVAHQLRPLLVLGLVIAVTPLY